jgi:hypothetical protein
MAEFSGRTVALKEDAYVRIARNPQQLVGKLLLIRLVYDTQAIMMDVRFEVMGGRLFACGTVPEGVIAGYDNKNIAIAWEQVEQFYAFDSVEEWKTANKSWKASKKKVWFWWDQ